MGTFFTEEAQVGGIHVLRVNRPILIEEAQQAGKDMIKIIKDSSYGARFIIDFADTKLVDRQVMGAFHIFQQQIEENGGKLTLVLKADGADSEAKKWFEVYPNRAEAIAAHATEGADGSKRVKITLADQEVHGEKNIWRMGEALLTCVESAPGCAFVVDFSKLTGEAGSAVFQYLLKAKEAMKSGGTLALANVHRQMEMLKVMHMDSSFTILPSESAPTELGGGLNVTGSRPRPPKESIDM